ncbi:MAG: hypothetical protein ABS944_17765 [Solibacillus sp.]|uniref:DUF7296 family protein n=1 Tax=Solibacillus sp. TaxID=1909654 RepID=UPI003315478B
MKQKYFTAHQNNSGGYFIQNDDVKEVVIIQAENAIIANKLLLQITEEYSEYCSCCGERWDEFWDDSEGTDVPEIYGTSVYETSESLFRKSAIIYHANGRKEIVEFSKKDGNK